MTTKMKTTKICDVENCGKPARHTCAACGIDLCGVGHTHSFGDGGHIEHACPVDITTFPYGGPYRIWLCPKCITHPLKKSLWELHNEGEQLNTSNNCG